jgi:hypothetical protein
MKKSKIKDIYEGEYITVWEDGEWVTLAFPYSTVAIPKENWEEVKQELKKIK